MEGLLEASRLLRTSLDRYISACSAATTAYDPTDKGDYSSSLLVAINHELETVAGFEKDLACAKPILARGRNSSHTFAPINSLPSEVLGWIFELAYYSWLPTQTLIRINTDGDDDTRSIPEEYDQYKLDTEYRPPLFPEALSHVCSRWRQVALSSHKLWSRIDLPMFRQSFSRLLFRGTSFTSRVGLPTLDIHVLISNTEVDTTMHSQLNRFFTSVGSKTKSFQLVNGAEIRSSYPSDLSPFLNAAFVHFAPGTLDHLSIIDHFPPNPMVIKSTELVQGKDHCIEIPIHIPQLQVDEVLRPIKSLWLKNHYFPWESPAYYGLVDLRLLMSAVRGPTSIKRTQLAKILSSCPKLRVFHCNIEVKDIDMGTQGATGPVYLAELEELNIRRARYRQYQDILSLILPGTKSLSLSIQVTITAESLFSDAVLDFFSRSNVTALHVQSTSCYASLPLKKLLTDVPNSTRIIGLEECNIDQGITEPAGPEQSYLTRLDCLNLVDCIFYIDKLSEMVNICPVQVLKLTTSGCVDGKGRASKRDLDELSTIFPVVKCINSLAPMEDWNSWGIAESEWKL